MQFKSLFWTPWFGAATLCWAIPAVAALNAPPIDTPSPALSLASMVPDLNDPGLLVKIMHQNILMTVVNLSGYVSFGATSLLNLVVNGLTAGIATRSALAAGVTWPEILRSTLPHSMELVGLWLSGGIGLQGAKHGYQLLRHGRVPGRNDIRHFLIGTACSAVIIAVAAWMEVFVSLRPLM